MAPGRQLLGDVVVQLARNPRALGLLSGKEASDQALDRRVAGIERLLDPLPPLRYAYPN
jgi:hypothetical protein